MVLGLHHYQYSKKCGNPSSVCFNFAEVGGGGGGLRRLDIYMLDVAANFLDFPDLAGWIYI